MPGASGAATNESPMRAPARRRLPVIQPRKPPARSRTQVLDPRDLDALEARPRYRAECLTGPRPCPWVSCRHHLMLDVGVDGEIHYNFRSLDEMARKGAATCSLDVAEDGEHGLKETGAAIGVGLERARQIQNAGLASAHLRVTNPIDGFDGRRYEPRPKKRRPVQLTLFASVRLLAGNAVNRPRLNAYAHSRMPRRNTIRELVSRFEQLVLPALRP